jgi:hypothetical protein
MPAKNKKHSLSKKIARIAVVLFLSFLLLLTVLLVVLRLLYPPEKLQDMAVRYFEQTYNRQLIVGDVELNLFRGFVFNNIQIPPVADSCLNIDFPIRSLRVERIAVGYNLRQLLSKKFIVRHISIHNPHLELCIQAQPSPTSAAEDTVTAGLPELPLEFDLRKLRINNLDLYAEIDLDSIRNEIGLENIYLSANDVIIPGGELEENLDEIRAELVFKVDNGFFFAKQTADTPGQPAFDASGTIDLQQQLFVRGAAQQRAKTFVALNDLKVLLQTTEQVGRYHISDNIALVLEAEGNYASKCASIKTMRFSIGDKEWLSMSADFNFSENPEMSVRLGQSHIPVEQIISLAASVVSYPLLTEIKKTRGNLVLDHSEISGHLGNGDNGMDLNFELFLRLEDLELKRKPDLVLDRLNVDTRFAGKIQADALKNLNTTIHVFYDTLSLALSDTLNFATGACRLNIDADLNEDFLPANARLDFALDNIFGASLRANARAKTLPSQTLSANADIHLTGLNTAELSQGAAETKADFDLNLNFISRDSITVHALVNTDSIKLGTLENQMLQPVQFELDLTAQADPAFRRIELKHSRFTLNEFLTASAKALVNLKTQVFELSAFELVLQHSPLYQSLPPYIHQQLYDFSVDGQTTVHCSGRMGFDDETPAYRATAKARIENMDIRYPSESIELNNIQLDLNAAVESGEINTAEVVLRCDSILFGALRRFPYVNNRLSMLVESSDLKVFSVRNGAIKLADIAEGDFTAKADSRPHLDAELRIRQVAGDSLEIVDNILVQGKAALEAIVAADTALADLTLFVHLDDYSVYPSDSLTIHHINSDIRLRQQYDLTRQRLIARDSYAILTPSEGLVDYLLVQEYYPNQLSTLTIDSVKVIGYKISDLNLKIDAGEGFLEIPCFSTALYGGSLAGRMSLDLAEGILEHASWRVSSHFSNINSGLLLSQRNGKEEKSTLNGNLEIFGNGMDPEKEIEIGGHFYITRVGPQVVNNILQSLDPRGEDANVSLSQRLLSWGFQPDVLTFDIRHRYLRPVIAFKQPWYFPIRLSGGKIELARVPVNFFVQNALKQMLAASQP